MSIEFDARAEAEKRRPSLEPEKDAYTGYPPSALRYYEQGAFVAGAEWQASRPVTDAEADAAQIAFHEFVFGLDEPLTARDIGVTRQAWKVAIQAARALAGKETP